MMIVTKICFESHCIVLQGFGMLLMEEAERIAREEHGSSKMAVISGETIYEIKDYYH